MPKPFRLPQEGGQTLGLNFPFTRTATVDTAFNVASLSGRMEEGVRVALIVDLYDAFIRFDADAERADSNGDGIIESIFIPAGRGYFEDQIYVSSRISAINAVAGQNCRVTGIIWGR